MRKTSSYFINFCTTNTQMLFQDVVLSLPSTIFDNKKELVHLSHAKLLCHPAFPNKYYLLSNSQGACLQVWQCTRTNANEFACEQFCECDLKQATHHRQNNLLPNLILPTEDGFFGFLRTDYDDFHLSSFSLSLITKSLLTQ